MPEVLNLLNRLLCLQYWEDISSRFTEIRISRTHFLVLDKVNVGTPEGIVLRTGGCNDKIHTVICSWLIVHYILKQCFLEYLFKKGSLQIFYEIWNNCFLTIIWTWTNKLQSLTALYHVADRVRVSETFSTKIHLNL